MNIVLFIVFIIIFAGNKKDRKNSDLFKWLLKLYIGVTILGAVIPSPIFWIIAIAMIAIIVMKKNEDKKAQSSHQKGEAKKTQSSYQKADYDRMRREWEQRNRPGSGQATSKTETKNAGNATGSAQNTGSYSSIQTNYSTQGSYTPYTASKILPKPLGRRNKIISAFNDRYDLSLTEAEIHRIAEASYVSEAWKREVESMTAKYETEGQWFAGPTDWLRVYIYAFYNQNISSDFSLQEQICFETLDEVMAYACAIPDATIEERIQRINDRYFTRFNEMSFMIAYRFLQRKGRNYDLSRPDLVKNVDQELEEALKKYQTAGGR
ncbi:MAG: hypothetical protein IJZ85_06305 [Lachnospiraceae bacterium]|nr:hypothetical protein [Lachnospiraceae bacterium]